MTLGGGEILGQPEFVYEILRVCKEDGINTAIETSGYGQWEDLSLIHIYMCIRDRYNSVEVYISFLRKKMSKLNSDMAIKTVRGRGYLLDKAS